ncbi:MAG: response regulator [Sedimentisphaerales bacterium]|nr:response regulator [Sedimentisphaerales bacterium]
MSRASCLRFKQYAGWKPATLKEKERESAGERVMAKSLMIVDDSATMRKIIMRTMRMSGLEFNEPQEAGNGKEALEKLSSGPVDIVLCDINMPEMNGMEFVKKARELSNCANTKIIMVSTESAQELIDNIIADGANGYITKPFTPEKFQEKLSPFMN